MASNKQEQGKPVAPVQAPPSPEPNTADAEALKAAEEAALLAQLQEEEDAKEADAVAKALKEKELIDAMAAQAAAQASAEGDYELETSLRAQAASTPRYAPKRVVAGDVRARALKDQPIVPVGGRVYCFVKGRVLEMDPSHARDLAASGWVKLVEEE